MPIYVYECAECEAVIKERHSIKNKLTDCPDCESANSLKRVLNNFVITNRTNAGKVVKSFIEDSKKDLEVEKENLKKQEYKE